jgi:hypothetical protein
VDELLKKEETILDALLGGFKFKADLKIVKQKQLLKFFNKFVESYEMDIGHRNAKIIMKFLPLSLIAFGADINIEFEDFDSLDDIK